MTITTVKVKLRTLNRHKESRLQKVADDFASCVRYCLRIIRQLELKPAEIYKECYWRCRACFPNLLAQICQKAINRVEGLYRAYLTNKKKKRKCSFPRFTKATSICVSNQTLEIRGGMLRLRGFGYNHLWLPFIPTPNFDPSWKLYSATLTKKGDGTWYAMLQYRHEDVPMTVKKRTPHFGLDLGLANVATLSGPNVNKFFDGNQLRYVRSKYFHYRQELGRKKKLGKIKRSKGKESNWVRDMNHKISRTVVDIVATAKGVLHVECLKGIRERMKATKKVKRMLHSWPFGQLLEMLRYKGAMAGVTIVEVDPRHTSQMCSECSHTERANRPKQSKFKCKSCGYELHADLNAARNIAARRASSSGVGSMVEPLNGEVGLRSNGNHNSVKSHVGNRH